MELNNPKRRNDILTQESGSEVMLYDATADELHVLNPTAQFIWVRCDGLHSVAQIVDELRTEFVIASAVNVQSDIEQTINEFGAKRLLQTFV